MDFHLPDGRTISPYCPPLSSPVFGLLLCVSSSIGGRLMPSNNILKFWCLFQSSPNTMSKHPQRSNPRTPSLQSHSHCGRQFIFDCCVLSLNGSHLRPRPHPSLLDEPSLQPGCCCCCCGLLARLLRLLLLPRPAAVASSPDCCCYCCCCHLAPLLLLLPPCPAAVATAAVATSPDCCRYCCCCCCLLPPRPTAAAAAAARNIVRTILRLVSLFGDVYRKKF